MSDFSPLVGFSRSAVMCEKDRLGQKCRFCSGMLAADLQEQEESNGSSFLSMARKKGYQPILVAPA